MATYLDAVKTLKYFHPVPVSQLSSAKPVLSTFVLSRRPTAVTFINNQLEVREQGPSVLPVLRTMRELPNLALTKLTAAVATVSRPGHPCVRCTAPSTNQGTCVVPVRRLMAGLRRIKGCCDTA